jgi:tetratricopeptide (TPR) repeat protein
MSGGAPRRADGAPATTARASPLALVAPLLVLLLAAFFAGNRIRLTRGLAYFDPASGECLFWTEGAVQFRYARMVAEGEPIPARDAALQWPEGIAPERSVCLAMERTIGVSYRALGALFGRPPFHVWAAYAPHVVGALGVGAAYVGAAAAWGGAAAGGASGAAAGLLAAALYATSLATVGRAIGSFGHEDFALPWLFMAAAFLLRVARGQSGGPLAALCLAIGLGAWHFSRFVFLLYVAALGARLLLARVDGRARIAPALAWTLAGALAATAAFPVLRVSRFLVSPAFVGGAALLAAYALDAGVVARAAARAGARGGEPAAARGGDRARPALRRALLASAVAGPALLAAHLASGGESEGYGHVYALLFAKVRHLGVKPADPRVLAPEARSLWIEDFASPSAYLIVVMFGAPIALAAAALGAARDRRRATASGADRGAPDEPIALLLWLAGLTALAFLLVKRLFVVHALFLAVLAGGAALWALRAARPRDAATPSAPALARPRVRRRGGAAASLAAVRLVPTALLVAAVALETYKVVTHGRETPLTRGLRALLKRDAPALTIPNWHANDLAAVAWVRGHTRPDDAFVARVGSSPMMLAYAGRPIVLQPKYEVPGSRDRARAFDAALYGSEADLHRFCREHDARYYLHETRSALEWGPDSERYVGCAVRLPKSSAAFRLQYAGEESRYFRPLYRNASYCVYAVADTADLSRASRGSGSSLDAPTRADAPTLPPQPLYEIARFRQTLDGDFFDDGASAGMIADVERAIALFVAGQAHFRAGRYDLARRPLEEARALYPSLPGVNTYLGVAIALSGDYERALPLCREEIAVSPDLSLAYSNLGFVEANLGRYDEARAHIERAIALDPGAGGARAMLAQVEEAQRARERASPGAAAGGESAGSETR